jgi:glucan-binding YG repeat protein
MKLKKTLVIVLAACLLIGAIGSTTAMAAYNQEDMNGRNIGQEEWNQPWGFIPTGIEIPTFIPGYTGWNVVADMWSYYVDGVIQFNWQYIGGKWYYFDTNGIMISQGVAWVDSRLYLFAADGHCIMRNETNDGWYEIPQHFYVWDNTSGYVYNYTVGDSALFYLNENSYIETGWKWINVDRRGSFDGAWYMIEKATGRVLQNEWYRDQSGTYWYYLDSDGKMAADGWYTIVTTIGSSAAPWGDSSAPSVQTDRTYRFDANGHLLYGWFYDGAWYFLDPTNGARLENTWALIDGFYSGTPGQDYWYLFDAEGKMQTGWVSVPTGVVDYYDQNGRWMTNSALIGSKELGANYDAVDPSWTANEEVYWYYLTSWGGMVEGANFINGQWYWFNDGVVYSNWVWQSAIYGSVTRPLPPLGALMYVWGWDDILGAWQWVYPIDRASQYIIPGESEKPEQFNFPGSAVVSIFGSTYDGDRAGY